MPIRTPTPERLGAFSDGVIAVIITIMVLDLKAPHEATLAALLLLWPTFAAYSVSYLFVGVVWVNHHHLLRYTDSAEASIIWPNFLLLFLVSLIPFSTSFLAESRAQPFPTALYALVFLLITIAFSIFQLAVNQQVGDDAELQPKIEASTRRNWIALLVYALAIPAAYIRPVLSLALIVGVSALYLVPDMSRNER